ncbi:2-amino-4-hydroxy-6-hydroxymethyldihydropteridine diphosphokinase [Allorhizobium sp. BGMRC 0089]|uniref:2-amino-4-hydroxy-6- hydroxymethyldihydropteridine diphosphokinase n=1 Tax=Allorhizobium sonneratiae TaxID=2934936 RepID=UPI0020333FB6|nr:2-amino-4-hydroxy-6-hydroxymethyldihydropteridine diphosphokinase [Allorhizobium sonneratiae]MCM2292802.1 2-amino-4-hydroxy-6-hydroxymethyldihydropteridine diphosphokinase [Allorhizobium sonneratiae]
MPVEPQPAKVALGLGGNIDDPAMSMRHALKALDSREETRVLSVSPLYRTPPWGKLDQAEFFNACALIETALAPQDLLRVCLDLERAMKRVRLERWGPRTLDIDILLYDALTIDEPSLQIPHPRMLERAFVLHPLADIAADWRVKDKRVEDWLKQVDDSGITLWDKNSDWWRD